MPKGSPELTRARNEEIINACEKLYKTMSFKEITLKEISNETSFTRTSIYNYFHTKEEIFLGLFKREYELWNEALKGILKHDGALEPDELVKKIAATLQDRELMLKILSVNLYDMEENSRIERLVEFKGAYGECIKTLDKLLIRFLPQMTEASRRETVISILEFTHGIYPYAFATKKQIEAMEKAGVKYEKKSIYELAVSGLGKLLRGEFAFLGLKKLLDEKKEERL